MGQIWTDKNVLFSLSQKKRGVMICHFPLWGIDPASSAPKVVVANVYPLSHDPKPLYHPEINTLKSHANGTHRSFAHDLWISLLISQRNTFRNRWDAYLTYSVWIAHLHAAIMDCAQPEVESSSDPRKQLAVHYTRNGVLYYNFFLTSTAILK